MEIKKISDQQFKCIITKEDLADRNLKIEDLAYGTPHTKSLFKEITDFAEKNIGFTSAPMPIMIDAVPLEGDNIELTVTKIDDPEELDTRFSRFSPDTEGEFFPDKSPSEAVQAKANEILNLINTFREALSETTGINLPPLSESELAKDALREKKTEAKKSGAKQSKKELIFIFSFNDIDQIIKLSHVLQGKYNGVNSLYIKNETYFLAMAKSNHTPEEFNQICNIICEFGETVTHKDFTETYLREHGDLIIEKNALQELCNIQ